MELEPLEKEIISKLIFDEHFENIIADCKSLAIPTVIADILKYLIHHKLVVAKYHVEPVQGRSKSKSGFMYDSDRMKDYTYRITSKGIKCLA